MHVCMCDYHMVGNFCGLVLIFHGLVSTDHFVGLYSHDTPILINHLVI